MKILNKRCFLFFALMPLALSIWASPPRPLKVKIEGVNKTIAANIRAELKLETYKNKALDDDQMSQLLFNAKREVERALEPFGYYSANIQILRKKSKQYNRITIHIILNEPVKVAHLYLKLEGSGENSPDLKKLFEQFPLKPGMPLLHETYEKAKRELLATAYFSGFIKAEFTVHEIHLNLNTNQADVYLTLNTEQLYKMGPVSFTETYFDKKYLNRFVPFEPGDTFLPDSLLTLQRNFTLSDQFARIHIHQTPDDQQAIVPIGVELEKAKPNKYTFGLGYGTDTGVRGQAGWDRRWVNHLGHSLSVQGHLSEVYNQGYLEYRMPGLKPVQDYTALSLSATEDEFSDRNSEVWQLGVSDKTVLSKWERTLSLYYRDERFKEFDHVLRNHEKLLLPTLELSKTIKDNPINPLDGFLVSFKATGSIDTIFSDASFTQLSAKFNWLKTLHRKHNLLFRTQLGATFPEDISKLPLSMRFYAGGDNSLRGFAYRSLPKEKNTSARTSVGGAYLALTTLEWEYLIKSPFGVSTFIDAGNAFRNQHDPVEAGAGFGLRWHTPIGPLKIDLAKPLTSDTNSWRLHVTFGAGL